MLLLVHNDTDDTRRSLSSSKEAKRLTLPHPHSYAVWMTKALVSKKKYLDTGIHSITFLLISSQLKA